MTPMEKWLMKLIDDAPEGMAQVQITFHPGASVQAGGLRKGPVEGTFEFCTAARATENTPGNFRSGETVMISQVFEASAVQRVMTFAEPVVASPASPALV